MSQDKVAQALERFRAKCQFDAATGCVLWTAGQTSGRGHHVPYGAFWFQGRRWFAHRWAAKFIHGLDIDGLHVDHCCPGRRLPDTLCVQHLQAITAQENRELQDSRKRFVYLQVGLVEYEDVYGPPDAVVPTIPFFEEPEWFRRHGDTTDDKCPF